ncbi:hypothetical protein HHK36_017833 [Tetracentron sinense]|uniref:Phytochromobilin:ferredoxin oxidoreductase, chloroplastic n=1 Tax=Tetracentron sinense TaxID=13715 RepID=A0A834YUV9_TETSI|nr:hypothetical protein HHK36_017833 [Tetracentron sinense]
MESSLQRFSSLGSRIKPPLRTRRPSMKVSAFSYQKFVRFALEETQRQTHLIPSPLQEHYSSMKAKDGKTELQMLSFQAPNIRLLRSLSIEGNESMKVLDLAVFPEPEFDLPIFCANFFTAASMNIIVFSFAIPVLTSTPLDFVTLFLWNNENGINFVLSGLVGMCGSDRTEGLALLRHLKFAKNLILPKVVMKAILLMKSVGPQSLELSIDWSFLLSRDLNPLYDVINQRDYKEKYYKSLMPLGIKYAELLPWGGKLTSESLRFFSPIVIWTKFSSSQYNHDVLYSAFMDYFKVWLKLMDQAEQETDASRIICNREAQHKYLTWRAEKDPGHQILKKAIGESLAKDLVRNFLFNGVNTLGSKTFLDYFPEYCCGDGTINEKRSIIGKSFETRPWDTGGEFIGNELR